MFTNLQRWMVHQPLTRKLIVSVLVTTSVALIIACTVFAAYDYTTSRTRLVRDVTMLADVVGSNSTAALMFNDATAAGETLRAVSVSENVVEAHLYQRDGAILASYTRT